MRYKTQFKQKVIAAVKAGTTQSAVAKQFKIAPKTVVAWTQAGGKKSASRIVARPASLSRPKLDRVRDAIETLTKAGLL